MKKWIRIVAVGTCLLGAPCLSFAIDDAWQGIEGVPFPTPKVGEVIDFKTMVSSQLLNRGPEDLEDNQKVPCLVYTYTTKGLFPLLSNAPQDLKLAISHFSYQEKNNFGRSETSYKNLQAVRLSLTISSPLPGEFQDLLQKTARVLLLSSTLTSLAELKVSPGTGTMMMALKEDYNITSSSLNPPSKNESPEGEPALFSFYKDCGLNKEKVRIINTLLSFQKLADFSDHMLENLIEKAGVSTTEYNLNQAQENYQQKLEKHLQTLQSYTNILSTIASK